VRRLGKVAGELEEMPAAILGAMLEIAHETNSAADRLRSAQRYCQPLRKPRALFDRVEASPILEHCPELRLRALYGPGLAAEVVQVLERGPATIAAMAREVHASYSATHAAVARLEGRGSIVSRDGHGVELSTPVRSWIDGYPAVARKHRARLAS
jgi:hypothetical protein